MPVWGWLILTGLMSGAFIGAQFDDALEAYPPAPPGAIQGVVTAGKPAVLATFTRPSGWMAILFLMLAIFGGIQAFQKLKS